MAAAQAPEVTSLRADEATRLLYVWDSSIPGKVTETDELLDFALRRGMNVLVIEASPVGYGQAQARERYLEFAEAARGKGIRVLGMSGYQWFTVPSDAGVPGQPTSVLEGWHVYQNMAASGVFDGVLDDSQPFLTNWSANGESGNWFWDDVEGSAQAYLDYLRTNAELIGDLPYIQAIPCWYDNDPRTSALLLDGSTEPHPLSWYVAQIVDGVNVLAYRDYAEGPNGILDMAQDELGNGPCIVGVETLDQGSLTHTTFFEDGLLSLEQELALVMLDSLENPHFAGVSIHYRESLEFLEMMATSFVEPITGRDIVEQLAAANESEGQTEEETAPPTTEEPTVEPEEPAPTTEPAQDVFDATLAAISAQAMAQLAAQAAEYASEVHEDVEDALDDVDGKAGKKLAKELEKAAKKAAKDCRRRPRRC